MGIFDMFRADSNQNQPQQQQQPQNQPADYKQTGGGAASSVPGQQQQEEQKNPLDSFTAIWQNTDNAGKENNGQQQQQSSAPRYGINVDGKQIAEMAQNVNFVKDIPQEMLQKATNGDVGALLNIINNVGQRAMANAIEVGGRTLNHSLESGFNTFNGTLDSRFKDFATKDQVYSNSEDAKILSHPAVQPLVESARQQLLKQNPAATSAEIQQQLVSYFRQVGQAFGGGNQASNNSANSNDGNKGGQAQDFSQWFQPTQNS